MDLNRQVNVRPQHVIGNQMRLAPVRPIRSNESWRGSGRAEQLSACERLRETSIAGSPLPEPTLDEWRTSRLPPAIYHLCDFSPVVPGTFIDGLLELAATSRKRLGARTVFVFPAAVAERPWLKRITEAGIACICASPLEVVGRLKAEIRHQDDIILHSHFTGYDLTAFRLKIPNRKKIRVILHLHSHPEHISGRQRAKDLLKVRLLGRWLCDRSIAVSKSVELQATRRGFDRDQLILIENAIDLSRFAWDPTRRAETRASLGLDDRAVVALLLGWDPLRKGVDLYLEAAETIVEAGGGGMFCLVGRDETRTFVAPRQKIGTRLKLLEPQPDFPRLLNAVDVFVSASRREGLPYAVLEAMANEKLVIASEIEGAAASYGRSDGVWLFPVGRADRLTELLRLALDLADADRRALGRANRAFAEAHFALDRWAEQIVRVYAQTLGS